MSDDRADPMTPLPPADVRRVDEELREFLAVKRQERVKGYTLEAIARSIAEVVDQQAEHAKRIRSHQEEIVALQEWRAEHEIEHRGSRKASLSVPPMRNEMSTGRFEINARILAEAEAKMTAMIADERRAREAHETAKMAVELAEFRGSRRWWIENLVKWTAAIISGVTLAVLSWYLGRSGK